MRSAYYLITADHNFLKRKSPGYIGKVRSNFRGTEYNVFGQGENPHSGLPIDHVRSQQAAISYEASTLMSNGPRKMNVLIPRILNDKEYIEWKPMKEDEHMAQRFAKNMKENLIYIANKQPRWNTCMI